GAHGANAGDGHRRPAADATAVARLRAAGGVVLAITRAGADSPAHGPTRNPRDPTRAPGGSSTGAAALVAAGASPLALGSDSGGSIRLPAAWCGVAGLKPTFGRVPLTGHFPRCGSLEDGRTVIGPLAATVDDLAAVLQLIAGPDGLDAGVAPVPLGDPARVDPAALRASFMGGDPTGPALAALAAAGATIVEEPLADVRDEALELTRRYWRRSQLSGRENVALLWDWDRFRRRMLAATAGIDVLVTPAAEQPAPRWRESIDTDYRWMLPWSLTGAPAVVVPVASREGLPVAVQVVGRPWEDHVALAAARCIEAAATAIQG
ncbi:MAG TPA: amidase, partial [Candidatus Eisenbacteria bacterium]|nr:amidase [Candidatus Eisenbacteria bacterium]